MQDLVLSCLVLSCLDCVPANQDCNCTCSANCDFARSELAKLLAKASHVVIGVRRPCGDCVVPITCDSNGYWELHISKGWWTAFTTLACCLSEETLLCPMTSRRLMNFGVLLYMGSVIEDSMLGRTPNLIGPLECQASNC